MHSVSMQQTPAGLFMFLPPGVADINVHFLSKQV